MVAPDLQSGCQHVRNLLGVDPGPGGEHANMGTHNRLLRLGDDVYLEVIAVDPSAPAPGRPRWFELDEVKTPSLATWVARTALGEFPEAFGKAQAMSRGELHWRLAFPPDGRMPHGGVLPALIEWPDRNPARRMPDLGCTLERLELLHPQPDAIESLLADVGFTGPVSIVKGDRPALRATIRTPGGRVKLS